MSIDIAFFSFNQKRADAEWAKLESLDLASIADAHETKLELEDRKFILEQRIRHAQTAEAYLASQGISSPTEMEIFNAQAALEREEIVWQPVLSASDQKEKEDIEQGLAKLPSIPMGLAEKDFLYSLWPRPTTVSWLTDRPTHISTQEFKWNVKQLDLQFGSITVILSEPRNVEFFLNALFRIFFPEILDQERIDFFQILPDKMVALFEKMSKAKIDQALEGDLHQFLLDIDLSGQDAEWFRDGLIEFAFEIKPIAQDMKAEGSRLIVGINGEENEDLGLDKRAEERMQSLINKFPWIKERLSDDSS